MYFNNDLKSITWNTHNAMHLIGTALMTCLPFIPWWVGIAIMTLWEIGDGFKPLWSDYKPTGHKVWDLFRRECLYSDKFSLQDFIVWNMAGFGWGMLIRIILGAI